MDLVTTDGVGLDALSQAVAAQIDPTGDYAKFRGWFGPQIASTLQALVGQVLGAASVDAAGRVTIDPTRMHRPRDLDERAGLAARLEWLAGEIPSLQGAFGQLYDHEETAAYALVDECDELDVGTDAGYLRAQEIWQPMEMYYRWAQPNARVNRDDKEAVAGYAAALARWLERIGAADAERRREIAMAAGDATPASIEETVAAAVEVQRQLEEARTARKRASQAIVDADERMEALSARLTGLVASLPEGVDVPGVTS